VTCYALQAKIGRTVRSRPSFDWWQVETVYGYFQMMQKVLIFENPDQPNFEEYLARVMGQVE